MKSMRSASSGGSNAVSVLSGDISSEHLHEDTLVSDFAEVTLSTFYDGTSRATRSILVAHADQHHEADTDDGPGDGVDDRLVLASFELARRGGAPKADLTRKMHEVSAHQVALLLSGEPHDSIDNGDLIVAVLEAAAFFRPVPAA